MIELEWWNVVAWNVCFNGSSKGDENAMKNSVSS